MKQARRRPKNKQWKSFKWYWKTDGPRLAVKIENSYRACPSEKIRQNFLSEPLHSPARRPKIEKMTSDEARSTTEMRQKNIQSHPERVFQKVLGQEIDICVVLRHVWETGHLSFRLLLQVPTINDASARIRNSLTQSSWIGSSSQRSENIVPHLDVSSVLDIRQEKTRLFFKEIAQALHEQCV